MTFFALRVEFIFQPPCINRSSNLTQERQHPSVVRTKDGCRCAQLCEFNNMTLKELIPDVIPSLFELISNVLCLE